MNRSIVSVTAVVLLLTMGSVVATAGAAPVRVLVTPFAELGDGPIQRDWVGKAIHQSLTAELSRIGSGVEPVTPAKDATAPADLDAALDAGRDAKVDVVVFGSYQFAGDELRVTGQTVDVAGGKVIGGIKATGQLRDLFGVEDIIGAQVKRDLRALLNPTTQPSQPGVAGGGDPFGRQEVVEPTGPVTTGPPGGRFAGSDLERSLYDRVRYNPPLPPPTYIPPYGYGYGYYHPFRYRTIIIRPGTGNGGTVRPPPAPGQPRELPPNGNYIRPRDGNYIRGGSGNTMQGGPGNTMRSEAQER